MKVLSSSVAIKTLTGGGMEQFIEFQLDGNVKIPKPLSNQEDRPAPPIDGKWNPLRRLKKCQSFTNKGGQSNAKTPQLFGRPLSKICQDPCSLPKPVSEMLLLLKKRGPSAEGVFRKPCNSKNMREVREKLNGGLEVDMEGQPVTLLVGLLKSFLKELPGSLLVSELYDSWVAALDNEDAQQRGAAIRSMVDKLPAPNRLLLQHLLCVFHHILESSDVNKMDAYNLAVCIGPSLLQLDATALDEQKEKTQKVTELTQFLIEHFEILGENIPNLLDTDEDSLSSQHHDSAYDSTDPDGDGEAGESSMHGGCSSSSSLSPSIAASPWPSDTALSTKSPFNRRCSEPIILLSADIRCLHGGHARSHDDCSMASGLAFKDQPLTKQISDDSFLLRGRGLSFPKLSPASNMDPMLYSVGHNKDCSCSSLESAASNQSEGSVFSSSPVGSPPSSKKANSNQAVASVRAPQDSSKPDEKKRSQSMRVANKVLMRTRSLGAFSRTSLKRDSQKDFPCETLQEDSQSEADSPSEHKPRPLSAIEVFKQVDSRLPCRPPSYEHAVHNGRAPRRLGSMTVHDAIRLERRSRPSSLHYDRPSTCAVNQYADCFGTQESACAVEQRVSFRQRAMSESVSAGHHEAVSRRCSQPVFEEFSYAKESYV